MGRVERIHRIIFLREYLEDSPRPNVDEIANSLCVSPRTLFRDLRLLRTATAQIQTLMPLHNRRSNARLPDFTAHEAAICLAVLLHDLHFDRQSCCGKLWENIRLRIANFIEGRMERSKAQIDEQLRLILSGNSSSDVKRPLERAALFSW